MKYKGLIFLILILALSVVFAQRRGGGGGRGFGGGGGGGFGGGFGGGRSRGFDNERTPREIPQRGRAEDGSLDVTPYWTNAPGFERDTFTFVRIKRSDGRWSIDTPDSDLWLSYRLQNMTSIKVNPDGLFLSLTDKELSEYPFIYMVEPGGLYLNDDEVLALRKYLLNGGFLWLDDFWGDSEWDNMERVLKRVFPDRNFVEMSLDHPLYHSVFEIKAKNQIPAVDIGTASEHTGVTWETFHDGDVRTVHHKAIFDDKGRIMVFATHNTDNGDGWEHEGANHYYFEHFSEKTAYPLAINVIFYVMTH